MLCPSLRDMVWAFWSLWISITFVLPVTVYAQQTFFPQAAIPLAIRSPHFSIWYNCPADGQPLSNSWLDFWNGVRT